MAGEKCWVVLTVFLRSRCRVQAARYRDPGSEFASNDWDCEQHAAGEVQGKEE